MVAGDKRKTLMIDHDSVFMFEIPPFIGKMQLFIIFAGFIKETIEICN